MFCIKNLVKVVGAIIENDNTEVLCTLHSASMRLQNFLDLPDVKIEEGILAVKLLVLETKKV